MKKKNLTDIEVADNEKGLAVWLKREKAAIIVIVLAAALIVCLAVILNRKEPAPILAPVTADLSQSPVLSNDMAVLRVSENSGIYSFSRNGIYLCRGDNEGRLYFSGTRSSGTEWRIEQQNDGCFAIVSSNALTDGSYLAVSCIGGFTAYAYRENAAAFKMQFYLAAPSGSLSFIEKAPEDGDSVVIYFPQKTAVLSWKASGESKSGDYAEYEKGTVLSVSSDTTVADETSDGAYRGQQVLTVRVNSGQYKDQVIDDVYNYVGPLSGVPVHEGDGVSLIISTYSDGSIKASVYEYDRIPALIVILLIFVAVVVIIGGRKGIKSLVGLGITVLCLFLILIPLLLKGFPTLPTVFAVSLLIAIVCFTILGGLHRKTVCACLCTACGTAIALGFGLFAQSISRINGLRIADVEALLQLRQTGTPIELKGLLVGGIVISALGAVMDVAISISSSLEEINAANRDLGFRGLYKSGMNIGRDMVGTMTNTLILAFLGSALTMIIYLYSLGLQPFQLYPAYVAIELISGLAASVGMILAIPLTTLVSSLFLAKRKGA